ncbi:MAG: hypothetical protein KDK70_05890 [Myxococcales bacterium]|nr:hypothetical protein [Myxococcales bacterium]
MRRTISSLSTTSAVILASLASGEALAAVGGPDGAGYSFADQADGAVYNYVDISATGTIVTMGDDFAASIPLGAPFEVYGLPLMDMVANTNGFLTNDAASAGDVSNDCPLPVSPSTGAGFRVNALHDDLETTVYYQYFTEVEAAALGYPGETAGISVFQWVGNHFGGGPAVDFEMVLFHDDFSMLDMIAADGEGGSGSTLGIQNDTATIALNYMCNTAMSVVPGATAVLYTLGQPADSNCCTPSAMAIPGCTNGACQSVVCGADPFCCSVEWDMVCADEAVLACPILCGAPPPVTINTRSAPTRWAPTTTSTSSWSALRAPRSPTSSSSCSATPPPVRSRRSST